MGHVNYKIVLECEKNRNPQAPAYFVLGYSESPQISGSQPMWPTGRWPLTVLCNQCFHLFECSETDIRTVAFDNKVQEKPLSMKIWCIKVQCGLESCGPPAKVYFQSGIGAVKEAIELQIFGEQIHVPCQKCGQQTPLTSQSCKNICVVCEM